MTQASAQQLPREDPAPDGELVARILGGERALFAVLMRRYNQRLFRAVRAILRSDDESEDVAQHAYVSAYRSLASFRGEAKFSTWLTRIAVNEALSRMRKSAHGAVALVEHGREVMDREGTPEDATYRR